jgi:hypothetical protein
MKNLSNPVRRMKVIHPGGFVTYKTVYSSDEIVQRECPELTEPPSKKAGKLLAFPGSVSHSLVLGYSLW